MSVRSIDLKVIVGLGNPGPKYTETRHNAGFWFVEEVARKYGAIFRQEKKFHGEVAKVNVQGKDIWLLKPDTFMNRSGLATNSLLSFYRISAEQLLVAHDEIDLPPGTAKLKTGGGHGGHGGLVYRDSPPTTTSGDGGKHHDHPSVNDDHSHDGYHYH